MTKLIIALSFLLFVGSPFANAEYVYYCSDIIGTGIIKDEKSEWESARWKLYRHTIKFNEDFTKLVGLEKDQSFTCSEAMHGVLEKVKSIIICNDFKYNMGDSFIFDRNSLRYLHIKTKFTGWVLNGENADTNAISGGTCQKF